MSILILKRIFTKQAIVFFITSALFLFNKNAFSAQQAQTSFTVSTTVTNVCLVVAVPLVFLNYNPQAQPPANVDASTTLTVTCTIGTSYTVGLDKGTGTGASDTDRIMTQTPPAGTIHYSLFQDSNRTTNWGNTVGTSPPATVSNGLSKVFNVYGRIPSGTNDPTNIPAGAYQDTITATVNY